MIQPSAISITACDTTRQKRVRLTAPLRASVGEVLDEAIPRLNLNRRGPDGEELSLEARLDREARHLHRSEQVGQALRHEDTVTVYAKVIAG